MGKQKRNIANSWLFKWFVDNQIVSFLLVLCLAFLALFLFTKVSFIFTPVISFIEIVALPMILTGLLFYILNPIVDLLERYKVSRTVAITILFVIIAILLIWGVAVAIPSIQNQISSIATNAPRYVRQVESVLNQLLQDDRLSSIRPTVLEYIDQINEQIVKYMKNLSSSAVDWAGNFISTASQIVVAILILPFILFYLLRDGKNLKGYMTNFLPNKWREPIGTVMTDVNSQLANYVRGQVTVAVIVAFMFSAMFSIIGLNYAVTLGILAGFLNLIPYLGSFLAMIPAVILGIVAGPFMLVKVLIVFVIEQTIEGRFVTPLIIGSSLNIHPITILFVLLTAGQMYGIWGVLLGIPIYASIKVIVTALFKWYKKNSSLFTDEDDVLESDIVNE